MEGIRTMNKASSLRMITVATALSLALIAPAMAAELTVRVSGIEPVQGRIMIALHKRSDDTAFPDPRGVVSAAREQVETDNATVVFRDLEPGAYAVAAFHDADSDNELDVNLIGIPTEGVGFSNGAVGHMGPPSFEQAQVTISHATDTVTTSVSLSYPGS